MSPTEWNRSLSRLCHSCKTIKPLRASHCKICNKCVLAFDHHCPYVQNCIGYKNRVFFFMFVTTFEILQLVVLQVAYITLTNNPRQYILYPGLFIICLYTLMVGFLVFSAVCGALYNMTTNEVAKKNKYDYLQMSVLSDGSKTSLFNRGYVYNCKYYFHLVEPNPLETIEYNNHDLYCDV